MREYSDTKFGPKLELKPDNKVPIELFSYWYTLYILLVLHVSAVAGPVPGLPTRVEAETCSPLKIILGHM